jgi:hypothetical protein
MKKGLAKFAGGSTLQTNIQKSKRAPKNADISYVGIKGIKQLDKESVYNMEVDTHHNFSVNGGIIVHNCMDDIRYLCYTVLRYRLVDDDRKYRL